MHIRYAGIITRKDSPNVLRVGQDLAEWYRKRSIKAELDQIDPEMDMLTILGGDGTLLHVADQAARYGIPVVGINLGNLGFLTEVAAEEMYQALDEILLSGVTIEERMMLRAELLYENGESAGKTLFALNEVVIVKSSTEPMMRLGCWADREYITTYKADGLIVSTPTGSTAYNLSAGGPIAHAELRTLLVTPICPFMLESRPVLLSPRTRVTAQLAPPSTNVKVMVDGRLGWTMRANDFLSIEAAVKPLRLISSPHKGYFDILRNKLNWGGRDPGYPLPEALMA
ncbi:MAG: NAD(+)/NADH kinase [Candidatus Electrothrix aestuarii]|uniref:NAD kinase n=1 Tax=Candidatus Electrothrix aestuarii TaxID=3062594 RepID=A0AAU8LQJ1_9BACT|nr:NAD(+)/NADH kinase [Candidatus Electrothrix aestuarii]